MQIPFEYQLAFIKFKKQFLWRWIGGHLIGFLLSLIFVEVDEKIGINLTTPILGSAIIGLAETWALPLLRNRPWWILINMISWGFLALTGLGAIGWNVPQTTIMPLRIVFGMIHGMAAGVIIGGGQWLVLKNQIPQAWRWLLATSVGWAIALAIGWTIGGILKTITGLFLAEVIGLAITWLIVSWITGMTLIMTLEKKFKN